MLTRTIKNTKVTFFNANMSTMTIEEHTEFIPTGMSETQVKKYLGDLGYSNPMEIKTENIPAARYAISDHDFFLHAQMIDKKSDIKGRSITKEMTWTTATAVMAVKENESEWTIKSTLVFAFNGNFDTTEYNSINQKILEVGEFKNESTALFGMSEEDFIKYGTELE